MTDRELLEFAAKADECLILTISIIFGEIKDGYF